MKGEKEGGIRLREIERERDAKEEEARQKERRRRRRRRCFFLRALFASSTTTTATRAIQTPLHSLYIPAARHAKKGVFLTPSFSPKMRKSPATTTTTMPRVVAAAAQQKTNTTVGAALLTDRASRTLIETQLRVALDAVCYQRGARERRRGNDGPFSFATTFDFEF